MVLSVIWCNRPRMLYGFGNFAKALSTDGLVAIWATYKLGLDAFEGFYAQVLARVDTSLSPCYPCRMFKSVRWQLILNSMLVTVVAILAIGVVTLVLVGRYFLEQERTYLVQRADAVLPVFVPLFRASQPEDIETIITMTSFFSDVRIELLNADDQVIADSGPREPGRPFVPGDGRIDSGRFAMRVHSDGSVQLVRNSTPIESTSPFATEPNLVFSAESPITSISSASLTIPLQNETEIIGYLRLSEGPAAGQGVINSIRNALIWGVFAALIVAVLVGSISGQQIARPLGNLEKAAMAMANDDLSARAPLGRLAEFNQLANQFNRMADQIGGNIERLESERNVLRRMIADASHELRTPLTALKTFNTLLQDEVHNPMAQQLVQESEGQINQLDQMTTGLLDLSRLEARISGTEFIEQDLRSTVQATIESLKPFADSREQAILYDAPDFVLNFRHDPDAMQQAIGNILQNGLKYSNQGRPVTVLVSAENDIATIKLSDEGGGISAEALPHIFNRFYRDPAQTEIQGTGLGLAIAKEIVSIHGGNIAVTSSPDKGTTFSVTLPIEPATT